MTESSQTNEFLRLLMAHQKRIYAFILATVPNHQDADDLFQETVLLMWSKFDDFQRGTSFVGWGITVAKYQILSVRKRHSVRSVRFSEMAMELLHSESDPFLEQMDSRIQALRTCLRKLSPRDYELICLRYQDEVTAKSIAQKRGHSVQSIYKRMARIHEALLRCVRRAIGSEELA
jgi:RNA polymerase sigma-70 factor (ECF subfamily)